MSMACVWPKNTTVAPKMRTFLRHKTNRFENPPMKIYHSVADRYVSVLFHSINNKIIIKHLKYIWFMPQRRMLRYEPPAMLVTDELYLKHKLMTSLLPSMLNVVVNR